MYTILCPECGTVHPADATRCTQCGASLELESQDLTGLEEAGRRNLLNKVQNCHPEQSTPHQPRPKQPGHAGVPAA